MEQVKSQEAAWVPPVRDELEAILTSLLTTKETLDGPLTVVRRRTVVQGTYPKEVVTCRLHDGSYLQMLCKYEAGHDHSAHGHRFGVAHEAMVYQRLLHPLRCVTPKLYGVRAGADREVWLVVEYLQDSTYVSRAVEPEAIGLAACWIGRFHAESREYLETTTLPFLKPYDEDYYLGWAQRTWHYLHGLDQYPQWLEQLCKGFPEAVAALLSAPPTVVHGEYYPQNVLWCEGAIFPVDWESAAVAAGEIDLASLIERWPEEIVRECERKYQTARWPEGVPDGFERRLWTARLYLQFRWLGDHPERDVSEWRLEALRSAGERLGLL